MFRRAPAQLFASRFGLVQISDYPFRKPYATLSTDETRNTKDWYGPFNPRWIKPLGISWSIKFRCHRLFRSFNECNLDPRPALLFEYPLKALSDQVLATIHSRLWQPMCLDACSKGDNNLHTSFGEARFLSKGDPRLGYARDHHSWSFTVRYSRSQNQERCQPDFEREDQWVVSIHFLSDWMVCWKANYVSGGRWLMKIENNGWRWVEIGRNGNVSKSAEVRSHEAYI